MEIERLQAEIRRLMEGIEHPRVGAALALTEECGEVVRCVLEREYYGADNRDALQDEVGDVLLALTELCDRYDLSLQACADGALAKRAEKAPGWRRTLGPHLARMRDRMDTP